MHVDPLLKEKAFVLLYNPLKTNITRKIKLPLYYTGLTKDAKISLHDSSPKAYTLSRDYHTEVEVTIPADGYIWLVVR